MFSFSVYNQPFQFKVVLLLIVFDGFIWTSFNKLDLVQMRQPSGFGKL